MKTLIDQQPWLYEPSLTPMPWKTTSKNTTILRKSPHDGRRKLRIGILSDDGIVKPHPPILRGITSLTEKLQSHPDISLVNFPPYRHDEAWRIASSLYFGDGAHEEIAAIEASGEPWRPLSTFIIKENPNVKALTLPETWKLTTERDAYKAAYTRHWNSISTNIPGPESSDFVEVLENVEDEREKMVDVILCPVGPGVAPVLDTARYWNYTSQWNLLDYPALVFPTGLACDPMLDKVEEGYRPRNEKDEENYKKCELTTKLRSARLNERTWLTFLALLPR